MKFLLVEGATRKWAGFRQSLEQLFLPDYDYFSVHPRGIQIFFFGFLIFRTIWGLVVLEIDAWLQTLQLEGHV